MKRITLGILAFILIPLALQSADRAILDIQPVPELDGGTPPLESLIGAWDGSGRIDAIYGDRIVINDSNFNLGSGLELIGMDGRPYKGVMAPGTFVYYFLASEDTIVKLAVDPGKLHPGELPPKR